MGEVKPNSNYHHSIHSLLFYLLFGTLHEGCHLAVTTWLTPCRDGSVATNWLLDLARAVTGRYSILHITTEEYGCTEWDRGFILHSGWIFSVMLALFLLCSCRSYKNRRNESASYTAVLFDSPMVYAAVLTAVEAVVTDLLHFTPKYYYAPVFNTSSSQFSGSIVDALIAYCGNFGIILLNPMWLNVDGGRTALEVLEKMVEVTMMRGAQSGGVVTFEPTSYSSLLPKSSSSTSTSPLSLRGIRSRTINAKRSDLSHRIIAKIKKDNCTMRGNLRGWNKPEYNVNSGRLIRAFFGHTRFATSSKASCE